MVPGRTKLSCDFQFLNYIYADIDRNAASSSLVDMLSDEDAEGNIG